MADSGSFKVHGKEYSLPTDLTMGEMCDAEREFGVEFGKVQSSGVRMAAAMIWLAIRRVDDSITVEDIRRLPIDVFESIVRADDAGPPDETNNGTFTTSGEGSSLSGDDLEENPVLIGDPG